MWGAQLSTGEWVQESAPLGNGELSPWQMLLMRCHTENLRIVQLRLEHAHVKIAALPRCEGYFQAYEARHSNHTHTTRLMQGIGSVLGNLVFINWIDEDGYVSQEVRDLGAVLVHTTQRTHSDVLVGRR